MKTMMVVVASATLMNTTAAKAADIVAGKEIFRAQCSLCHSAESDDNGGAQGPDLHDVFNRAAAGAGNFGYTDALKKSGLIWNAATLDRFLASPAATVPGTTMAIAISDAAQRADVIAYFQTLKRNTSGSRNSGAGSTQVSSPASNQTTELNDDWKHDKPGRVHRIDLSHLPAPLDTPSAARSPKVVPKPASVELQVP
ncbi:MAG: c-type cytochrome, partial [Steroidobacter sp.]